MRVRAHIAASALALAGVLSSGAVRAEPSGFGTDHPFVLSLEHLGGLSYIRTKTEGGSAQSITQVGLFTPILAPTTPQARLGLHYFVAPQVSLGALLGYIDNDQLGTSYLVGARIGYAVPFSESSALWLRGGAFYMHTKVTLLGSETVTNVVPGGEALFVFRPDEHFGILLGPMFEIGVAGKQRYESGGFGMPSSSVERNYDYMEVGLSFGVLTDF